MLQFSFAAHNFYIFTHIPFNVNNSYFHFERRSSISILSFNNVNFQIKQYFIFQKFSWNSVQPIWGIIMNLTEITYTKLSLLYKNFRESGGSLFLQVKTKRKASRRCSRRSMLNQSKEVLRICVSFQESRESIKKEPKNERL